MRIHDISDNYDHSMPPSKLIQEFKKEWDTWYHSPTEKNTEALLKFMIQHKEDFEKLAKKNPCPFSPPMTQDFDHYFEAATGGPNNPNTGLTGFLNHGCPKNTGVDPVSEFIKDVYAWVSE